MNEDRDDVPQHLEFILTVVERHARTSVVLKGWSVTIVAAVLVLAARGADPIAVVVAGLLPAFTFWGLDAYYLRQERMFRALYDHVRGAEPDPNGRFDLRASRFSASIPAWGQTLVSRSVWPFHAAVVSALVISLAVMSWRTCNGS
jgi:hypothetical protein